MITAPSSTTLRRSLPFVSLGLFGALLVGCGNGVQSTAGPSGSDASVVSASPSPRPSDPTSASATAASSTTSPSASGKPSSSSTEASTGSGGSTASSGTGGGSGGSSSGESGSGGSGSNRCTLGDLKVGVRSAAGGGAAGSNYVLLTFGNRSSNTCSLYGYPGVSFVGDSNGTQLGAAATRSSNGAARRVQLSPGQSTTALLQIVNAGNYDAKTCAPTTSDGFRVYPPGSTTSAYVPFRTQACQQSGAKQLSISPVGTSD